MDNISVGFISEVKLKDSGIRTIKNQVLLAPGIWNGRNYSIEEIEKAFKLTDWNDKDTISLIADHRDDDSKGRPLTIRDWLGYITNPRLDQEKPGYLVGDLNLCDPFLATQLIDGKAPFGISPFVSGIFDQLSKSQKDFTYKNFAVVVEPACKESYINHYLSDDNLNEELKELSIEKRIEKRTSKLAETTSNDIQGNEIESKGLQPIDYKKKKKKEKSDLKELKGGKKMAENEEEKTEEVKEEVKEVEVEDTETKEPEEEVAEEVKVEESEEDSEEKLLDNIAKMTEKLLSKRKMTPEQSKLNVIEKEVTLLKDKVAKLEQEKLTESKEEVSKEKLSAKPKSIAGTKLEEDNSFSFGGSSSMKGSRELAAMMNLI